jgi:hypothetical protein
VTSAMPPTAPATPENPANNDKYMILLRNFMIRSI